jgi:large subunit ribosomal protein L30
MLRIKLVKSTIGHNPRLCATIQALGLKKLNSVVEHEDSPSVRGQIHHVKELLRVEDLATGAVLFDGLKVRKHATAKQKKPSERHASH